MWIRKRLSSPITVDMIDEAEDFANAHGEPFDREPWEYIVEKYNGFIPIKIKAVKEGIPIPSQNALYVVTCEDKKVAWIASYLETSMQRAVWYPTTIASMDYEIRKVIEKFFELSVDPVPGATTLRAKYPGLAFMLHDFGGRGVSSEESAQIGSMAHLVNFTGSDTISGIRAANFYYNCKSRKTNTNKTSISGACLGKYKKVGGYIWKYFKQEKPYYR
jgi:nicotinamide phosphoribosyltransferase